MAQLDAHGTSPRAMSTTPPRRLGVIGSFVWDVIYGRDPRSVPVEEWGGITYALGALDAALPASWEIVPIMKIGNDLASRAGHFLSGLRRVATDAPLVEVPTPTSRVELRYVSEERRTEQTHGGVLGWSWPALRPLIETARLDALYVNFLSGWELDLETALALRAGFSGPIYCDLHMLATTVQADGMRAMRMLPDVSQWCSCFDLLQVNEDEMACLAPDPMALAATAMAAGVSALFVTLGKRGAVYFAAPEFDRLSDIEGQVADSGERRTERVGRLLRRDAVSGAIRTALVPAAPVDVSPRDADPTGCGDVWGATCFSQLVAGDMLLDAMRAAHRAAARNVGFRGATGLANHLRGELTVP
jgi:sugar/nucleoside kinase (ribokinase family)